MEARGAGYLDKELSVYDAATSYFLGLAAAYTFNWRQSRLYFGEVMNMVRVIGAHRLKDPGHLVVGDLPLTFGADGGGFEVQPQPVDYIRQEIGRRVYWLMFVGVRYRFFHQLHKSYVNHPQIYAATWGNVRRAPHPAANT